MVQIFTDSVHKLAYATDASVYREIPCGVAYPSSVEDIQSLVAQARLRHTNIIARAGGTSIAGQVVGNGIVADVSRYLNRIIEVNPNERYAWVEPGVVRDELNLACRPYGLFFSPETSTSNRCCIGGMFGNNSCGTHSLVYGSTRNHVSEAYVVLSDGSTEHIASFSLSQLEDRFGQSFWTRQPQSLIESIYSQLINYALQPSVRQLIADTFPDRSLARRSCGYALDEVIEGLQNTSLPFLQRTINLCHLLAGSEGTLAFAYQIKVMLDPLPPQYIMALCAHCVSLESAFEANLIALNHRPTAVELMDGEILQLSQSRRDLDRFFVCGNPPALLIVELRADSEETLRSHAALVEQSLLDSHLVTTCTRVYGSDVNKVWNLRKAGLGVLNGMKGDAKPTGVIEDTAVTPQRLPAYIADFRAMLADLGVSCVFYGHISTGELHLRPILNLKTEQGRHLFHEIAYRTALLVRQHRGTISGEHGDGRLRGEFIPLQYGSPTYELMRDVKFCWDQDNIFNPNKIIDAPPMDEYLRCLLAPTFPSADYVHFPRPILNWKAAFDECRTEGTTGAYSQQHALMCSVEQCNGTGDCRKSNLIGGTLCPAFKFSHDELQSTRARANIMREYLYALCNGRSLDLEQDIMSVLSTCLACKGCQRECPSGVDMTRLRSEILQHIYNQRKHVPLRTYMIAHNADIQRLGSLVPHLYNFFASNALTSWLLKTMMGFAQNRAIPLLATSRQLATHNPQSPKRKVIVFVDEFTKYQDLDLAQTFVDMLNRLGYEVEIFDSAESGRAAISKGLLRHAAKLATRNIHALATKVSEQCPIVGIEPSCILTFRDEYPDLVDLQLRGQALHLAKYSMLYDEFLVQEVERGHITSDMFSDLPAEIYLHGHCHQKALVGIEPTARLLDLPCGTKVNVIPSGCCGMAGSFGYEKDHYKTSIAIGEMVLFPAVRRAVETHQLQTPLFIAAPGVSCRTQIFDGTGIKALHPIEILFRLLK